MKMNLTAWMTLSLRKMSAHPSSLACCHLQDMLPPASTPKILPLCHSSHVPQTAFYGNSYEYVFSPISSAVSSAAQGPYLIHGYEIRRHLL